jgi:hypothetical protein
MKQTVKNGLGEVLVKSKLPRYSSLVLWDRNIPSRDAMTIPMLA